MVYHIVGGQKRLVSPFVFNQRFAGQSLINSTSAEIAAYPEGPYVTPLDGTLVKLENDQTVYIIQNGQKLPITYQVYTQRKLNLQQVNTLSYPEVNSWPTGNFLPPLDGTLVRGQNGQNGVLGGRANPPSH